MARAMRRRSTSRGANLAAWLYTVGAVAILAASTGFGDHSVVEFLSAFSQFFSFAAWGYFAYRVARFFGLPSLWLGFTSFDALNAAFRMRFWPQKSGISANVDGPSSADDAHARIASGRRRRSARGASAEELVIKAASISPRSRASRRPKIRLQEQAAPHVRHDDASRRCCCC